MILDVLENPKILTQENHQNKNKNQLIHAEKIHLKFSVNFAKKAQMKNVLLLLIQN